jgi:hypothetical protein
MLARAARQFVCRLAITHLQHIVLESPAKRESESVIGRNRPDMGAEGTKKLVRTVQVWKWSSIFRKLKTPKFIILNEINRKMTESHSPDNQ